MKRVFISFLIILVVVSIFMRFYNSNERLLSKIIEQKKYSVTKQNDKVSIVFKFDPKWNKIKPGREIEVNKIIKNTHNTTIYLEKVGRQTNPGSFYIQIDAKPNLESKQGEFIYINEINKDGTESTIGGKDWSFYLKHKKLEINYGLSSGPGNKAGVFIRPQDLKYIVSDTKVKFNGYKVYSYYRK